MLIRKSCVSGAILANLVAGHFEWRNAYLIGGGLGLLLLFLRVSVHESTMFARLEKQGASKGNFLALCTQKRHLSKYLKSIFVGIPIWFVVGILITFSPEFATALAITGPVSAGNAIMYCYLGLVLGDFASGLLSQLLKSRRKVLFTFLTLTTVGMLAYFNFLHGGSPSQFYFVCCFLGFSAGYWAIFVTIAAEQFGTNLRATVATTAPNFVRGLVVPMTLAFQFGKHSWGILEGGAWVGAVTGSVAFLCAVFIEETFEKNLDFIEET
ncbi:MFS transporter [Bdellovibrionota bacterium FG-2]